jgi:CRISPR-associated protein Cas5t
MMLSLYIEAPFAACRTFTAGWYRPTATFLTPSMMYGLLLNLAGVETRLREEDADHPGSPAASLIRPGLPALKIAIGSPVVRRVQTKTVAEAEQYPRVQTIYQQLHNYPVGDSPAKKGQPRPSQLGFLRAKGNKYNITPVRREILCDVRAVAVVDGNTEIEGLIRQALRKGASPRRYGLPFLGDNSFLPDRIETLDALPPVHWYERVTAKEEKLRPRTTRLTIWVDRADSSQTISDLFAPTAEAMVEIPSGAWVEIASPTLGQG